MASLIGSQVQNKHGARFTVTDVAWVAAHGFDAPVLCVVFSEVGSDRQSAAVPVATFLGHFRPVVA